MELFEPDALPFVLAGLIAFVFSLSFIRRSQDGQT